MHRWLWLWLFFASCQEEPLEKRRYRPALPDAEVHTQPYNDVLAHPWIKQQTELTAITPLAVEDIRSLCRMHAYHNKRRAEKGLPATTWEEESALLTATINNIQKTLDPLDLAFSGKKYSVLGIPNASQAVYPTPLPFQVYRREEFGQTPLGIPLFFDVRVFTLPADLQEDAAKDIILWHVNVLKGGESAFQTLYAKDALVLLGRADRNEEHFPAGHGFASEDRGVCLAFLRHENRFFVLHVDGPWEQVEDKRQEFLQVVNRPLHAWTKPIEEFLWQ